MRLQSCLVFVVAWTSGFAIQACSLAAENPNAEPALITRLPSGALGTVEVEGLAPLIDRIETSSALRDYLNSPLYDDVLKTDPARKAMAGKAIAEAQLGMSLWQAAKTYLGDRIALGAYPPSNGSQPEGVLIVQVKQASDLTKLLEKLSPLMALAGNQITIEDQDGGKKIKLPDGHFAVVKDRWFVLTKNTDLLRETISNLTSSRSGGLATEPAWKTMAQQVGEKHNVQVCVDLAKISELKGSRLVPEKLDNGVVSLFFGGVLELANRSPYLGLTVDVEGNEFSVTTSVAGTASELDESHRTMLVDPASPLVPLLPGVENRLAVISFSRGLAKWYKAREKILEAKLLPEFDKFETGLATFLPGKDFGEDVLPLMTGRIAFISAPQDYSYLDGKPGVQIPAFALVVELAKPQEGADILNLVGQTILTIRNLEAAKHKHQPWVQSSEAYKNIQINFARYLKRPKGDQLETLYNFQPANALVGNRFILSSSVGLCRQLIDVLGGSKPMEAVAVGSDRSKGAFPNFVQELSPSVGASLLEANAAVIHAKNVQNGKTSEQSTRELEAVCWLLRQLNTIRFDTVQYPDRVQIELHGGWK